MCLSVTSFFTARIVLETWTSDHITATGLKEVIYEVSDNMLVILRAIQY